MKNKLYHIWIQAGPMDCYYIVRARNLEEAKAIAVKAEEDLKISGREVFSTSELDAMDIDREDIPMDNGGFICISTGT